jgi:beta-lactamase class D
MVPSPVKKLLILLLLLAGGAASAGAPCTMVAEAADGSVLHRDGPCDHRNSPASTFKIALALAGYDSGILTDGHTPLWPYRDEYKSWDADAKKKPTDPTIWLSESVVWYSRLLTQKLGRRKLQNFVDSFDYGNRNLAGTVNFKETLPEAVWVDSSLRISPAEQVDFLLKLVNRKLPLQPETYDKAIAVIPVYPAPDGWTIHGKTGTGFQDSPGHFQYGWFVGWAEKGEHKVVFAYLIKDDTKQEGAAGLRARDQFVPLLPALLIKTVPATKTSH